MSDEGIGYGKPPVASRFKPGVSGNPKGRPKKTPQVAADIIEKAMTATVEFQERGVLKSASKAELSIKTLVNRAIKGDVKAAEMLLDLREHAERHGGKRTQRFIVTEWLPDYPGQTAEQKTREAARRRHADPDKWWNTPEDSHGKSDG